MSQNDGTIVMRDVELIFRNFSGEEGPFNPKGSRNFGVKIPGDLAETLTADGWNIKTLKPREEDEDDTPQAWLPVAIRFDIFPPNVWQVTSRGRTRITEDMIELFDWADIKKVDLVVRPFNYDVRGDKGIKAYVKSLFVTIEEDPLEAEYAELDSQSTEP